MSDDEHVKSGRLRRMGRLAYLTARTTGDLLAAQARRKIPGSGHSEPDLRKAAERILGTLGELKGAALKLGQALAMDPDALPPEARSIVAKLLSQAPQRMPFDAVAQVVREELGKPPDELFESFDREPIAAASLGQVHAARLKESARPGGRGSRDVVVKVQYPGVDKALESDLANASVLVKGFALTGETLDGRPYYNELRASLLRELDYREEARQARDYAHAARHYPELVVPEAIEELSGQRVLCLTRLRGPTLLDAIESRPDTAERFRIARLLVFAIWGPFFTERLIHADPHPGNFLVLPDGRLGVLDFGATKRLSAPFAAVYRGFLHALANGSPRPEVGPSLARAGFRFLGDDHEEAYDFCDRLADIVEKPSLTDDYDFGSDAMVVAARRLFQSEPRLALSIKPPAEALLFYRAAAGLAQDLRLLQARGPFRPLLKEIEERA